MPKSSLAAHVQAKTAKLAETARAAKIAHAMGGHSPKGSGGCGSGAGGFKAGNTCGRQTGRQTGGSGGGGGGGNGGSENGKTSVALKTNQPTSASPAVQAAHHAYNKSVLTTKQTHADLINRIRDPKTSQTTRDHLAKNHPEAKAHADAIDSYTPEHGTIAIGMRPGKPNAAQRNQIKGILDRKRKGETITPDEHRMLVDLHASRVGLGDSTTTEHDDRAGHQYLIHDRRSGELSFSSDGELQSLHERVRNAYFREKDGKAADHIPIRQFDSQGVEVPLDMKRYQYSLSPDVKIHRSTHFIEQTGVLEKERAAGKTAPRAKFGEKESDGSVEKKAAAKQDRAKKRKLTAISFDD